MLRRAGFRARPGAGALIEYELALRRHGDGSAGGSVATCESSRASSRGSSVPVGSAARSRGTVMPEHLPRW
jgi:hypothetical protein